MGGWFVQKPLFGNKDKTKPWRVVNQYTGEQDGGKDKWYSDADKQLAEERAAQLNNGSNSNKGDNKTQQSAPASAAAGKAMADDSANIINVNRLPVSIANAGEQGTKIRDTAIDHAADWDKKSRDEQNKYMHSALKRAQQTAVHARHNIGVNTQKTPEMLQSERYQRAADALNNATYWRQGVYGARTGQDVIPTGGVQEGAYQQQQIETEDMRQQALNRQRQADKQQYEELGKMKAADDVMLKISMGGALTENDLDKLRVINPMTIAQQIGVNAELLAQEMYRLPVDAKKALNEAAYTTGIAADKIYYYLKWQSQLGPETAIQLADALGIRTPSIERMIMQMINSSFNEWNTP